MYVHIDLYSLGVGLITAYLLFVFVFHWDALLTAIGMLAGVALTTLFYELRERIRQRRHVTGG